MGKSIITEFSILKFKKQNKEVVAFFFLRKNGYFKNFS